MLLFSFTRLVTPSDFEGLLAAGTRVKFAISLGSFDTIFMRYDCMGRRE